MGEKKDSNVVSKNRAIKIFTAIGFKTANKWDEPRLTKKLKALDTLVDGVDLDKKTKKRVNEILRMQKKHGEVRVVDIDNVVEKNKLQKQVDKSLKEAKEKKAAKKTGAKKSTTKKTTKATKKKEPKKPGVITTIYELIQGEPISAKKILSVLKKRFPERPVDGMEKTIRAQLPNRMAKEKGIKIKVDSKGRFSAPKAKKKK